MPTDTERLDWLSLQLVWVRPHLLHGSRERPTSFSHADEEDGRASSALRELIDKAMRADGVGAPSAEAQQGR